jgi:dTDP-4-amino-4,6-dideoxygalactose transaminase
MQLLHREVPFFDYTRLYRDDSGLILDTLENVGNRGAYILQKDLKQFEDMIANYLGASYFVGVGNATDGLELSWMAIGLNKGDEVIISSHTMLATASAIVTAGGTPVPVDIGDDNLICPVAIEAAITPRTVGISPTQLNGRTCNMDQILRIAERHHLVVVEDAAQALGSKFKGRYAGTFGRAGVFSFFPAKVLGSLGDGGGVVTNDAELFEKVFQFHDHGRNTAGEVKTWGRNSRLDNLQAAILSKKFATYHEVISRRRHIASLYQNGLGDVEELSLPPAPSDSSDHFDIYQNYELVAQRRDDLREFLKGKGVGTLIQWGGKGVHQWDFLGFDIHLPRTEKFFERCLMLPMNVFITDEDVNYVIECIKDFYSRH